MNESQRRAFAALGIGPSWQRRASPPPDEAVPVDTDSRSLFVLSDEAGGWLFVGEAQADPAGGAGDDDPHSLDSMRLLERMLVALELRPAELLHIPFDAKRATLDDEGAATGAEAALAERIAAIAPRVVVVLGAGAAQALLHTDTTPPALRGRVHEASFGSLHVPVVVSRHPSQLLAAPERKAEAWADLCLAREVVEGGSAADG